jgi:hypothetical protein
MTKAPASSSDSNRVSVVDTRDTNLSDIFGTNLHVMSRCPESGTEIWGHVHVNEQPHYAVARGSSLSSKRQAAYAKAALEIWIGAENLFFRPTGCDKAD